MFAPRMAPGFRVFRRNVGFRWMPSGHWSRSGRQRPRRALLAPRPLGLPSLTMNTRAVANFWASLGTPAIGSLNEVRNGT